MASVEKNPTLVLAHKASHEPGGADALAALTDASVAAANKDGASGTPSLRTLGTGATQAAAGNDSRLSDQRTPSAGSVTAAKFGSTPSVRVYNSAVQSIPNNTHTPLTFDTERWDTASIHSTGSDTSRLTCGTAGLYRIFGTAGFAASTVGARTISIRLNGTTFIALDQRTALAAGAINLTISTEYTLAATDYVELCLLHNVGGAINSAQASNYTPEFGMSWAGTGA